MFRGDHRELNRVLVRAWTLARDLGHPRVGSEHLLLSLTAAGGGVATALAGRGATTAAIQDVVCRAAPAGAGAAADRDILAPLGVDLDRLLGASGAAALDRPPPREPLLPLGAAKARRLCARLDPPVGWMRRRPTRPRCGSRSPAGNATIARSTSCSCSSLLSHM